MRGGADNLCAVGAEFVCGGAGKLCAVEWAICVRWGGGCGRKGARNADAKGVEMRAVQKGDVGAEESGRRCGRELAGDAGAKDSGAADAGVEASGYYGCDEQVQNRSGRGWIKAGERERRIKELKGIGVLEGKSVPRVE